MESYVGVDGCKAGWFTVRITAAGEWSHQVFGSAQAMFRYYHDASRILIDIPIGLIDQGSSGRACDIEARRLLGSPRSSSVFPVPCRSALSASSYEEASAANFRATGRKLSKQSWAILPKIREVDELLISKSMAREKVVEVHPELLFWSLNGQKAMPHNKKIPQGQSDRLEVLDRWDSPARDIFDDSLANYLRKDVARDDIIDAMTAAVVGFISGGNFRMIPTDPVADSQGLPMRMSGLLYP